VPLREAHIVVSSGEMSVRSSITVTSIHMKRVFGHNVHSDIYSSDTRIDAWSYHQTVVFGPRDSS
jgi:hypothetical protein